MLDGVRLAFDTDIFARLQDNLAENRSILRFLRCVNRLDAETA